MPTETSSYDIAQGSLVLNTYQITALANQIRYTTSCAALEIIISQALQNVTALIEGIIQTQADILADFFPILSLPSPNPFSIVKWIGKLVFGTAVTQYLAFVQYTIQLIQLSSALSDLISAINSVADVLAGCGVSLDTAAVLSGHLATVNSAIGTSLTSVNNKHAALQTVAGAAITLTSFNTSNAAAFKTSVENNLAQFKTDVTTYMDSSVDSDIIPSNRIINGSMSIAQRATSATVTAGTTVPTSSAGYPCVDRWFVYSAGANVTASQIAGSGGNKNLLQITGAASVTGVGIGQRISAYNSYDLAGTTCTLSADISNSLLTTVTWTAYYATTSDDTFGTIGTPTKTQIATGTFTVTSTLTRYNVNIAVPSAATTGIEILFTVGAQTSGTWQIGNVQFEPGSVATPYQRIEYGQELALCQTYYEDRGLFGWGYSPSTGTYRAAVVYFATTKRAIPTVSTTGITSYSNATGGSLTFVNITTDSCGATVATTSTNPFTVTSTLTASAEIP